MERLTKILIVVVIVLVAGFSLTIGLLMGNYFDKPAVILNNTTNKSTPTNNSTTTSPSSSSTSSSSNTNQESYDGDGRPCHYCGSHNTYMTSTYRKYFEDEDGQTLWTTVEVWHCNYCGQDFENMI
ncbi:MAG: hypothetical protein ACP5OJ_00080 [Methanothermobacter sp.]